ncbi:MAG: hypothetical protein M3346_03450 [Actinomycetota bacterium]|nr:hypothetical protein [Actinomycetota bacterium]
MSQSADVLSRSGRHISQIAVAASTRDVDDADHGAADTWVYETRQRIKEFGLLPRDWDSYGAPAVGTMALEAAADIVPRLAMLSWKPFVAPTSGGGVAFDWEASSGSLVIEASATGVVVTRYYNDDDDQDWEVPFGREPLSLDELYGRLYDNRVS